MKTLLTVLAVAVGLTGCSAIKEEKALNDGLVTCYTVATAAANYEGTGAEPDTADKFGFWVGESSYFAQAVKKQGYADYEIAQYRKLVINDLEKRLDGYTNEGKSKALTGVYFTGIVEGLGQTCNAYHQSNKGGTQSTFTSTAGKVLLETITHTHP